MICDLHLHSDYSDSSRSIEEVLDLAVEKGIKVVSFVDHDTTESYEYIKTIQNNYDLKIIPGIEISSYDYKNKRKVHLLAYNYSEKPININRICSDILEKRNENSNKQLKIIRENGFKINEERLTNSKNSIHTLYKQHIMYALTDADFDSDEYQNLYKSLFKNDGIAHFDIEYVDVFDALAAIIADGGTPVLAHPGELDSYDLIPELVDKGLKGIEVFHSSHTEEDENKCLEISEEYNLIRTGGSDDHGIFGKKVDLGLVSLDKSSLESLKVKF